MVKCAACKQTMLNADGSREMTEEECVHTCKLCKNVVHTAILCEAVWMPSEGHYFCSKACLQNSNASEISTAIDVFDIEDHFGPGHEEWDDWVIHADWFPLRRRPDGEEETQETEVVDVEISEETAPDVATAATEAQVCHARVALPMPPPAPLAHAARPIQ